MKYVWLQSLFFATCAWMMLIAEQSLPLSSSDTETSIIDRILGPIFGQAARDRAELKQLREKNKNLYNQFVQEGRSDFSEILKSCTADYMKYLEKRIEETVKKLGSAPTPFCVVALGSLAREEAGIQTDLELAILIEKHSLETDVYFKKFGQILADRFYLLGEHPLVGGKGIRIDEEGHAFPYLQFAARWASVEQQKDLLENTRGSKFLSPVGGSQLFLATPAEFAGLLDMSSNFAKQLSDNETNDLIAQEIEYALRDPHFAALEEQEVRKLVSRYVAEQREVGKKRIDPETRGYLFALTRNTAFISGERKLYTRFLTLRSQDFSTPFNGNCYANYGQFYYYETMRGDFSNKWKRFDYKQILDAGKIGSSLDIKRWVYRIAEQTFTNLGGWYNWSEQAKNQIAAQNTIHIAEQLAQRGLISAAFKNEFVDFMNYIDGLRLREQIRLGKQSFSLPVTKEEYQRRVAEVTNRLAKAEQERATKLTEFNKIATGEIAGDVKTQLAALLPLELDVIWSRNALIELKKSVPGEANSIITPQDVELLNTKYVPFLQKLYKAVGQWINNCDMSGFGGMQNQSGNQHAVPGYARE